MLAIKINNPVIESQFREYASQHKKAIEDVVSSAMQLFLDTHKKDTEIVYAKKDPMKHIHTIEYKDDGENLDDVNPYSHIEDSALYIHNIRRERIK